ncbi:MAG: nucleotidyltransferase family protein [Anaerohalosphaera sp.]|nr:nucleotidyltransferase family protein [Anaerohalosphaera sp.]
MSKISDITAVILVGGLGTRLRSVVSDRPKVLAEVCGRAFLSYLLDQIETAGIRRAVLCSGYMADMIKDTFGTSYGRLELCYSIEATPLGTGGALRFAEPFLGSDAVLVLNGDSYIDVDLNKFIDWYFEKKMQVGLLLTKVDDTSRYGRVCIDQQGHIVDFKEKGELAEPGLINAGIYLIERPIIDLIPENKTFSLEKELFASIDSTKIFGFYTEGKFIDIGTPQSYASAEHFFGGLTNC